MTLMLADPRRSEQAIQCLDRLFPVELHNHPELVLRLWRDPDILTSVRRGRRRVIRTLDKDHVQAYALGQHLRELRLDRGLRQEDLAEKCGIARPNIARIERGMHLPSMRTLRRLAAALEVSPSTLLETPHPVSPREERALAKAGLESWSAALDREDRR